MEKADKQNLGRTLSGLSNAQGGLVVWGVDARRAPDGIDCVQDLEPICQIERFRAEVEQKLSEYLMPRHEAIELATIKSGESSDAGYLAIWVGESHRRPHRSEAPDDKRYYRRTAFGTHTMEHYEIQDMFQLNTVAKLQPILRRGEVLDRKDIYRGFFEVLLHNESGVTAKDPYVIVNKGPWTLQRKNMHPGDSSVPNRGLKLFKAPDIHPLMQEVAFDICVEWKKGSESYRVTPDHNDYWHFTNLKTLEIKLKFGCENARPNHAELVISPSDIEELFDKVRGAGNDWARSRF